MPEQVDGEGDGDRHEDHGEHEGGEGGRGGGETMAEDEAEHARVGATTAMAEEDRAGDGHDTQGVGQLAQGVRARAGGGWWPRAGGN